MKRIRILQDPEPISPREHDNIAVFHCANGRNHVIGDDGHQFDKAGVDEARAFIKAIGEDGGVAMPLYLYEHSGITISLTDFKDRWDSGQVGWVYIDKETMDKECPLGLDPKG